MKTLTAENYPNLFNLLTLTEVTDEIIVEDIDAGGDINVTELINAVKAELGWGV